MTRTQVVAARLDPVAKAILDRLARISGRSPSDVVRSLIPPDPWPAVMAVENARGAGADPFSVMYALAAEGLRRIIEHSDRPLDRKLLDAAGRPEQMAELYLAWRDAVATADELPGPLGNTHQLVRHGDGWRVSKRATLVRVVDMLAGLRSDDPAERIRSGILLAQSIGAGLALAGEHAEDIEHGALGRDLSDLLGKAMAGETAAVEQLERVLTATPPAGATEPAGDARQLSNLAPTELLDAIEGEDEAGRRRMLVEAMFVSLGRCVGKAIPETHRLFELGDALADGDSAAVARARQLVEQITTNTEV